MIFYKLIYLYHVNQLAEAFTGYVNSCIIYHVPFIMYHLSVATMVHGTCQMQNGTCRMPNGQWFSTNLFINIMLISLPKHLPDM